MITKITGLPGNGKTLYTLNLVEAERKGRPVYYHGIAELQLDWVQLDNAQDWWKVPDGAIVVIDEAQKTFPPRAVGSQVPQHVSELETHRHRGIDVYLITQHPMLVDSAVRRLTQRHFHCVRKFGFEAATIHEYPTGVNTECEKNRAGSIRHEFKFPKGSYAWYKSAEVHTVRRRIPKRVWFLAAAPLLIIGLVWYGWQALTAHAPVSVDGPAKGGAIAQASEWGHVKTVKEYLDAQVPRVAGLAYTAPVYDRVTEPTKAPFPAACVSSKDRCRCFSQQGTALDMPDQLCRDVVSKGYFKPWDDQENRADRPATVYRQPARAEAARPGDADRYLALSGSVSARGNGWGDLKTFSTSKTEVQK